MKSLMAAHATCWFYIAWKPLVGCTITGTGLLELVTFRCLDKSTMVVRLLDNASAAIDMAQVLLMAVLPFSKIVISYFQVVSTFITTFQIEWPDEMSVTTAAEKYSCLA
ncbi:hypothetical protein T484DRAFT_1771831 [Baffinella frigidus]|nr:hypothetical protein T484DRAFT_1771831 [Cryptophyta sp. CCMP2293]